MESSYKKSKGNAGLDGVQFQIGLTAVFLLNALRNLEGWRMSSENESAGKFDDVVIELSDGSAVLLQAKRKDNKRIIKDQLLSDNSRKADFSLPKYFLTYQEIKSKFNVKNIIICTNADIDKQKLKDILTVQRASPDSLLHYEGEDCSFITFNENILSDLKANSESYYDLNMQGKGLDRKVISDENLRDFIEKLQFFTNYPSGEHLHEVIEQLLSGLRKSKLWSCTTSLEIYRKVEDWFKHGRGEYLSGTLANAMYCEIWSDRFCKRLKDFNMLFGHTSLSCTEEKRIYYISCDEGGCLIPVLKIYHILQQKKTLYVDLKDEVQKEMVDAFRLPKYLFLVLICSKTANNNIITAIGDTLNDILKKFKYKKVILVGRKRFGQQLSLDYDILDVDGSVSFQDLELETRERLIRKKSMCFQGEDLSLKELLGSTSTEEFVKTVNLEILEKLVTDAKVKVGEQPQGLDKATTRYYVERTIEREIIEMDGKTMAYKKKKEIISEEDITDVKEKVVLVSDGAGMGKSTVLTKIAAHMKEKYPYLWIIQVELNEYSGFLRDCRRRKKRTIEIMELLDSNKATRITNQLERFVFSMNQRVVVMLDGFDEISPDYEELVLSLLSQCQEGANFAKVFVTTRPHMNIELEELLKVKPFVLQPFTENEQTAFLTSYWGHELELDGNMRDKCEKYADVLINKMTSWEKVKHNFTAIPLQVRMVAEIFQENLEENNMTEWEGCKEFLHGDKEEPVLPEKMKITKLYETFIKKKLLIFLDKINPTGTSGGNNSHESNSHKYFVSHQSLAIKYILYDKASHNIAIHHLFSRFQYDKSIESIILKIGIVQMANGNLEFVHRTFAEFFVAKSILEISDLDRHEFNQDLDFQQFFVDEILCNPQFTVIRTFLDSALEEVLDYLPDDILEEYRSLATSDPKSKKQKSKLLHLLAREGNVSILQAILKSINFKTQKDTDTNETKNERENTLNLLRGLVEQHGVDIEDEFGHTPLHNAIEGGYLNMVRYLVEQGANINCRNHGGASAMHFAARINRLEIMKFLMEQGDDIIVKNNRGYTALHCAAEEGHLDVCTYLIEKGVDVNLRNKNGFTPLVLASLGGHLKVVRLLVEYGEADVNVATIEGFTALHRAAQGGYLDICKFLIERGVDVDVLNKTGFTPLVLASFKGHLDVVKLLVQHGRAHSNAATDDGSTSLHCAAQEGHLDVCKFLIEGGIDVNLCNDDGFSALVLASFGGFLDVIKFLVEQGQADINVTSNDGSTALHCAAQEGHLDVCKFLVEKGIDVNLRNKYNDTALLSASVNDHWDIVRLLTEYGHQTAM